MRRAPNPDFSGFGRLRFYSRAMSRKKAAREQLLYSVVLKFPHKEQPRFVDSCLQSAEKPFNLRLWKHLSICDAEAKLVLRPRVLGKTQHDFARDGLTSPSPCMVHPPVRYTPLYYRSILSRNNGSKGSTNLYSPVSPLTRIYFVTS